MLGDFLEDLVRMDMLVFINRQFFVVYIILAGMFIMGVVLLQEDMYKGVQFWDEVQEIFVIDYCREVVF